MAVITAPRFFNSRSACRRNLDAITHACRWAEFLPTSDADWTGRPIQMQRLCPDRFFVESLIAWLDGIVSSTLTTEVQRAPQRILITREQSITKGEVRFHCKLFS